MALEQPTNLTAALTPNFGVILTWQDNSTEETGFQIQRATGAGSFSTISSVGASVTSFTDTNVTQGLTYNYRVGAFNVFGFIADSPWSSTATVTILASLAAPTGLTLTELAGPSVIVEWDTYTDDATAIAIFRSESGAFTLVGSVAPNIANITFTDNSVISGKIYEYKLKAINIFGSPGDSPFSESAFITISGTVLPEVLIPLGVVFYNTLQEYSLFDVEAVKPAAADTDLNASGDDWINIVRDLGALGDGSNETVLLQQALDMARSAVLAGTGKRKVLIPSQIQICVGPVEDDLSTGTFFGSMGVCLWLDSGVTLRIDGVLRACYDYTFAYPKDFITILESRNSFVGTLVDRDESITIEGNGTIDLEGIYASGVFVEDTAITKEIKNIVAFRSYKADKVTIKDITIKHGISNKIIHGFSNNLDILNIKFQNALKYESNDSPIRTDTALIALDVCNKVRVSGCLARECGIYFGITDWASKEVNILENNLSDLLSGDGTLDVNAKGTGFWFVDYGMEYTERDMDDAADIYDLAAGLDSRTLVSKNIFCRNGINGIKINGGAFDGILTGGMFISFNKLCSNGSTGLFYCGCKDYLFNGNQKENNGYGLPLQFD